MSDTLIYSFLDKCAHEGCSFVKQIQIDKYLLLFRRGGRPILYSVSSFNMKPDPEPIGYWAQIKEIEDEENYSSDENRKYKYGTVKIKELIRDYPDKFDDIKYMIEEQVLTDL
jgi:hypothetical protein